MEYKRKANFNVTKAIIVMWKMWIIMRIEFRLFFRNQRLSEN